MSPSASENEPFDPLRAVWREVIVSLACTGGCFFPCRRRQLRLRGERSMESGTIETGDPHARTCAADSKSTRKPRRRFAGALVVALALLLTAAFGATGASAEPVLA